MIEKTYRPAEVEARIYATWESAGAFRAGRPERAGARPYCIVIPPPNVTGTLHMGHALNNTLQDILVRFERMRGRDVLWQPGTDHAGIATQMVVERQLMERQEPDRRTLGRAEFIKRVWAWKEESGGAITRQLKRLGASCDWSRERFTMDEGLSRAVIKVFVELYNAGLIYKDKRLVNWDPKLRTAISDLEVQQVEVKGHLWYIKYPIEGLEGTYITVATTRPETMLGDTAVAVHPDNARLKHLIDKTAILPLVGRRIPVIGDDYADPEKGTGAVKITPAHDFNDFEVGKRHGLPQINILNSEAEIAIEENKSFWENTKFADRYGGPDEVISHIGGYPQDHDEYVRYRIDDLELDNLRDLGGLDRFVARNRVVGMLEAAGLIDKIEPHTYMVPHGDRSGAVIEPFLTDQWYVNAKTLAQPAIAAVREGATTFVPKNWERTYFEWMENILPWCISRQLWWGHQIPAWYGLNGDIFCELSEAEAIAAARAKYGKPIEVLPRAEAQKTVLLGSTFPDNRGQREFKGGTVPIWRDEDVLDTWFSSALWPFSTLGWPDQTPELARYYPTDTLVTGFDIIFFWVARMMMMGLRVMEEVPFSTVYIHALVRDAQGAKMSKSKGNVIDPLHLIDDYGADALRFTLAVMAAQGRDIKLSTNSVEGYRNFATKLWNAARFGEINGCVRVSGFDPRSVRQRINRWIGHETAKVGREVTLAIEDYKFNEAAAAVYRFVWNIYCDWYLELAKPILAGPDGRAKSETQAMTAWVLDEILKLLHPFMPFITEELWRVTGGAAAYDSLLALASWPRNDGLDDPEAESEIGWVIDLIGAVRSVRAEMNVPPGAQIALKLDRRSKETGLRTRRWRNFLKRLARLKTVGSAENPPPGAVQLLVRGEIAALPLAKIIDFVAERARLEREMGKVNEDLARANAKLANADFLKRAPEEVVEGEREKREEAEARRMKIVEALDRLEGVMM
ncbi:MAG TPA: valine--tRNA ligase [Xanthobacteraceae bacterium]|nr:valine--tRNA ligase [Xanthobacteraceae bacterium]